MARKVHTGEELVGTLREAEIAIAGGASVLEAMRLRFVVTTEKDFRACLCHGVRGLPADWFQDWRQRASSPSSSTGS